MKRVRFLRQWTLYNGGEVAGFPDHVAESLCSGPDPAAALVDEPAPVVEAPAKAVVEVGPRADAKRAAVTRKGGKFAPRSRGTEEE